MVYILPIDDYIEDIDIEEDEVEDSDDEEDKGENNIIMWKMKILIGFHKNLL